MGFPQTLTPAAPSGLDSPRLGDDQIRDIKQLLADLFGFPVSPSSISAAIGAVSTGGKLTITNGLWNGDVLGVLYGGTGLASGTSGGILGYTATGTLASSVALTANALILGAGAGATPTPLGSLGTTTTLLHGNAAGAPTFGAVSLTADVTGILPGANGGTANGFFAVSGPTTSLKTFTFPDASSTILYSGGALGTPSSGVATNLTGLPAASVLAGTLGTGAYVMDTSLLVPTLLGGTGTTSDLNLKTTSGVGAAGADMHFLVGNNGATEAMTILNSGNVGIGTTNPLNLLTLGTASPQITVDTADGADTKILQIGAGGAIGTNRGAYFNFFGSDHASQAGDIDFFGGISGDLRFFTDAGGGSTLKLMILNNGNVGIGGTPAAKLHVIGGALLLDNAQDFQMKDSGGTARVILRAGAANDLAYSSLASNDAIDFYQGPAFASLNMRMKQGNIGIRVSAFGTSAVGVLGVANGTAPASSPADMIQLWAEDIAASSELRVRDEAGNVTTLSPHPTDFLNALLSDSPLPWAYRSHNDYVGQEVTVDMAGLVAEVERLSGKKFVTYRAFPKRDWQADQVAQVAVRNTEIATATKAKADLTAESELETDAVKKIEKQRQADAVKIPTAYTAKRPPIWMQRRGVMAH